MKTPKKLLITGVATVFGFGLLFGQQAEQEADRPGATEDTPAMPADPEARQEIETEEFGERPDRPDRQSITDPERQRASHEKSHRASELEGSRVENNEGDRLGTVDSLAVDLETGELAYVVVSAGGFLGIGDELKIVPPDAFEVQEEEGAVMGGLVLRLDIDEQEWEEAPTLENREEIQQFAEAQRGREVYQHYGLEWEQRAASEYGARDRQDSEFGAPVRDQDEGVEMEQRQRPGIQRDDEDEETTDESREFGAPVRDEDEGVRMQQRDQSEERGIERRDQDEETSSETREFGAQPERGQQLGDESEAAEPRDHGQQQEFGARSDREKSAGMKDEDQSRAESRSGIETEEGEEQVFGARGDREKSAEQKEEDKTRAESRSGIEIEEGEEQEFGARGEREKSAEKKEEDEIRAESRSGIEIEEGEEQEFGARDRDDGMGQLKLSNDLQSAELTGAQDEQIGQIDDLLVDLSNGQITFVLITPDTDFWETADGPYAVAPQAISILGEDRLQLSITQQELEQAQQLTRAEIGEHARRHAMNPEQVRQDPQVFRLQEEDDAIFGRPDRERDSERQQDMDTPDLEEENRQQSTPRQGREGGPPPAGQQRDY